MGGIFIGYSLKKMGETIVTSFGYLVLLAVVTGAIAFSVTALTDFDVVSALLAFAPGGQAEAGIIAMTMGADTGYVALHHLLRLVIIVSVVPVLYRMAIGQEEY